jgi:hypothetical protein
MPASNTPFRLIPGLEKTATMPTEGAGPFMPAQDGLETEGAESLMLTKNGGSRGIHAPEINRKQAGL